MVNLIMGDFKKLMSKLPSWYGLLSDWVPMAALVSGVAIMLIQIYYVFWLDKPYYEDFADFELLYGRYVVPSFTWLIALFLDAFLAFVAGYLIMSVMKVSESGTGCFVVTYLLIYLLHFAHWVWFLVGWYSKEKQNAWWSDSKSERPTLNHINMMLMLWLGVNGIFLTVINSYWLNMAGPPKSARSDEIIREVIHTSGDTIVDIVTPRGRSKKRSKSRRVGGSGSPQIKKSKSRHRSRQRSDSSDASYAPKPKKSRSLGAMTVAPVHRSRTRTRSRHDRVRDSPPEAAPKKSVSKASGQLKGGASRRRSLTSESLDDSSESSPRDRSFGRSSRRSVTVALVNEATSRREAGGRSGSSRTESVANEEPELVVSKKRSKKEVEGESKSSKPKKSKKAAKKERKDEEVENETEDEGEEDEEVEEAEDEGDRDEGDSCQETKSFTVEIIQPQSCSTLSGIDGEERQWVQELDDGFQPSETLKRSLRAMDRQMNSVTHKMKSKACERQINEAIRKSHGYEAMRGRERESLSMCSQIYDSSDSDDKPDGSQSSFKSRLSQKISISNESIPKASRPMREAAGRSRRSTVDMRHAMDSDEEFLPEALKSKLRSTLKKPSEGATQARERASIGRERSGSKLREPAGSAAGPSILKIILTPAETAKVASNVTIKKPSAAEAEADAYDDLLNPSLADTTLSQTLSRVSNATSSAYTVSDEQLHGGANSAAESYVDALMKRVAEGKSKSKSVDLSAITTFSSAESKMGTEHTYDSKPKRKPAKAAGDVGPGKTKKVQNVKSTTMQSSDTNPDTNWTIVRPSGTESHENKTESQTRPIRSDGYPGEVWSDSSKPRLIQSDSSVPRTAYSSDNTTIYGAESLPRADKKGQNRSRSLAQEIIEDLTRHTLRSRGSDLKIKQLRSRSEVREKAGASEVPSPSRKRTPSGSIIRKPRSKTKVQKSSGKTSTDEETETARKTRSKKAIITISGSKRSSVSKVSDTDAKKSSGIRVKAERSKSKTKKPPSDTKLRINRSNKREVAPFSSDDQSMDLPKKEAPSSSEKVKTSDSNTSESAQLKRNLSKKLANKRSRTEDQYSAADPVPILTSVVGRRAGGRSQSRQNNKSDRKNSSQSGGKSDDKPAASKNKKPDGTESTQTLKPGCPTSLNEAVKVAKKKRKQQEKELKEKEAKEKEMREKEAKRKEKESEKKESGHSKSSKKGSGKSNKKRKRSNSSRESRSGTSMSGSGSSSSSTCLSDETCSSSMDASIRSGSLNMSSTKYLSSRSGRVCEGETSATVKPSASVLLMACQFKPSSPNERPATDAPPPPTMTYALIKPSSMGACGASGPSASNASKQLMDSVLSLATLTSQIKGKNDASREPRQFMCAPQQMPMLQPRPMLRPALKPMQPMQFTCTPRPPAIRQPMQPGPMQRPRPMLRPSNAGSALSSAPSGQNDRQMPQWCDQECYANYGLDEDDCGGFPMSGPGNTDPCCCSNNEMDQDNRENFSMSGPRNAGNRGMNMETDEANRQSFPMSGPGSGGARGANMESDEGNYNTTSMSGPGNTDAPGLDMDNDQVTTCWAFPISGPANTGATGSGMERDCKAFIMSGPAFNGGPPGANNSDEGNFPMSGPGNAGFSGPPRVLRSNPPCGHRGGGRFPIQPPRQPGLQSSQSRNGCYQQMMGLPQTYSMYRTPCPTLYPAPLPLQRGRPGPNQGMPGDDRYDQCPRRAGGSQDDIFSNTTDFTETTSRRSRGSQEDTFSETTDFTESTSTEG